MVNREFVLRQELFVIAEAIDESTGVTKESNTIGHLNPSDSHSRLTIDDSRGVITQPNAIGNLNLSGSIDD